MEPLKTNTILYCKNWAATVEFYRNRLQLPVTLEKDWFVEFRLCETSLISIANAARASIRSVAGQGITLSWQVSDLGETKSKLESAGVKTGSTKVNWGAPVFYFHDPEGHRIEFWESV